MELWVVFKLQISNNWRAISIINNIIKARFHVCVSSPCAKRMRNVRCT